MALLSLSLSACRFGFELLPAPEEDGVRGANGSSEDDDPVRPAADAGGPNGDAPSHDASLPDPTGADAGAQPDGGRSDASPGGDGDGDASPGPEPDAGLIIIEPDAAMPPAEQLPVTFTAGGITPRCGVSDEESGEPFAETCPRGYAITGYRGYESTDPSLRHILRIQAVCGRVLLDTAEPDVAVESFTYLDEHGAFGEILWQRLCPQDQFVIGFSGYYSTINFVNQLTFYCASLSAERSVGGYAFSVGSGSALPAIGVAERELYPRADCPPGQVATGNSGRSGFYLDAIELTCGVPTVR